VGKPCGVQNRGSGQWRLSHRGSGIGGFHRLDGGTGATTFVGGRGTGRPRGPVPSTSFPRPLTWATPFLALGMLTGYLYLRGHHPAAYTTSEATPTPAVLRTAAPTLPGTASPRPHRHHPAHDHGHNRHALGRASGSCVAGHGPRVRGLNAAQNYRRATSGGVQPGARSYKSNPARSSPESAPRRRMTPFRPDFACVSSSSTRPVRRPAGFR